MSLFWYPELNEKYTFDEEVDKGILLTSYINYFLARLQSMFIYNGLPDSIPQKWLENYLLVNGSCVWIDTDEGLIVTRAGIGGKPDKYYIPTECIVTNPYINQKYNRTYTRDEDCVLMVNDTYAQGILPLLKKYCSMLVENDITMNIADIMSRAALILSAADDQTKASAELFLKRLWEGKLGVIGESPFLVANQDNSLTVNKLSGADSIITNLIEYHQYLKASLFNELGLNSNYNMKRESINSNESQLNDDMLHPLIDNMLECRREALEKVNAMFGTNITVDFNSAWESNEIEEAAAVDAMEAEVDQVEAEADKTAEEADAVEVQTEVTEEQAAEQTEETSADDQQNDDNEADQDEQHSDDTEDDDKKDGEEE